MCFKRKTIEVPPFTDNTVSSMVVGNYPGTANDLAGCPNDQVDFEKKVLSLWPHYTFRKFKDDQVTTARFKTELELAVTRIKEGDLLLFIMDNCFSSTNTRNFNSPKILGSRFHDLGLPPRTIVKKLLPAKAMNYISMSACMDNETAADAEFNGRANGAFHYALIKTMRPRISYYQWHEMAKSLLKQLGFAQTPTLEGPPELCSRKIFEGNVTVIEVSSHGTYTYDTDGDEADGQDEAVYLYNGLVTDDEINKIISLNPYLLNS